ncbi:MAG TPA: hypothetical protein PLX84_03545 [Acidiphilium sp.]|nr:hypothetical protein [Acidiphilium sp.]
MSKPSKPLAPARKTPSRAAAPAAPAAQQQQAAPDPTSARAAGIEELKVSAHMMTLDAGLFCLVNEASPGAAQRGGLPGVRISPPPQAPDTVEILAFRPDGWLSGVGDAALIRVSRGPAQVMVTVYQQAGQADSAPRLQVLRLAGGAAAPAPAPAVSQPATPAASERMDLLAHIQTRGDVGARFGDWLGEAGSGAWIEGIAIAAPEGFDPADLSYQAVLGRGWLSPWVDAGQYCGSRGMALPLLGFRVRLQGEAAKQFDLKCEATFVDGSKAGPLGSDETCEAESLSALEAVRITLLPRQSAKSAPRARR